MAILKDLIVHGSSRFLNKIYASEIQTPLIDADAGVFKKLKADDATVVGLLDVKGQLHTNSWSNSNIATIDGSFYITPTIGSASGTVTITASSLVFSGTNYAVSSLYLGDGSSITWPQYSKVLVTGQILSNGEWIPLGTLLGQLSNTATAASISINNIKDNKNQTSNVLATLVSNGTTSSNYRNLKVSLYQRASSSTAFYPLGIYMTATGTNGRTFLDIYGGVESLSPNSNYCGFAEPNVRIGNLQGLPNVGGQTPSGWGIYTDNGYFKGIIAADKGYIGSGSRYWVIANYEDDSNSNNSRSYIYSYNGTDNGTNSITSTVEGIYLGTDGIRNYKDSTHNVTIANGVITALGVNLTGTINATAGNIGGANITGGVLSVPAANISGTLTASQVDVSGIITAGSIVTDTLQGGTFNTTDYIRVSTQASSALTIGTSGSKTDWRILAGKTFGVDKAGNMYATSATISGNITATSGTIGGIQLDSNGKMWITDANISGTISSNHIDVSSISIGMSQVTDLTTTLAGKQAAGDYATNTALNNVSTVANTALSQSSWYATCPTPGGTTEKVATITPATTAFTLTEGATVNVKFDVKNEGAVGSITLNVNGTGAKNIKYINNNAISNIPGTDYIAAGRTYQFVYDGTYWVIQNLNYNTNTNTIGTLEATKLIAGTNVSNASATTVYRYTLIMKKTAGDSPTWVSLVTSSSTATSKTRYTGGLYPDKIFYMSSNVSRSPYGYTTGASTGDSYAALGFDLRYSTNCGSTLTIGKPVYLVGEINSLDGLFYLDSTWWTQTEPTMEDGKTYIYLGNAYSTTNVYLVEKNPLMRYYRGAFRTEEQIAGMTATSYITYIDANNGIQVHNYNNVTDYIQINSDAISMYRGYEGDLGLNSKETLRIEDENIRVGKLGANERNVFVTSSNVQIRNNENVLASYGDEITFYRPGTSNSALSINSSNIRIGQETIPHLVLGATSFSAYSADGVYFTVNSGSTTAQKRTTVPQPSTFFTTTYEIQSMTSVKYDGTTISTYSYSQGENRFEITSKIVGDKTVQIVYTYLDDDEQSTSITEDFTTENVTLNISLSDNVAAIDHVTVDGVNNSSYIVSSDNSEIIFTNSAIPDQGSEIIVYYLLSNSVVSPYFTFGERNSNYSPGVGSASFAKNGAAVGEQSFITGYNQIVNGQGSFATGRNHVVDGNFALASGQNNYITKGTSFALGIGHNINAYYSGAGGYYNTIKGQGSHAFGGRLETINNYSLACGKWNSGNGFLFSVGYGNSASDRKNAFGVGAYGNVWFSGKLISGDQVSHRYLFTTGLFTVDNITIPAAGGSTAAVSSTQTVNIKKTGYIAIGLMAFRSQNASSSGVNYSVVYPYEWWINQESFNFTLRNVSTAQAKVKITFRILYIAANAVQASHFPSSGNP